MANLHRLTATGLARRIRDGDISSVDVVDALLDRIDTRNERIKAFITVTPDRARAAARDADRAAAAGEPLGPLHGVPVAIKDLNNVAGVRTTFGSKLFEDNVADANEPFVDRLQAAGAIVIGKTNTPEFGLGLETDNLLYGPTGNPFDPAVIAGGSSGGAGAALADGLVPIAQGSDTGGSIRVPAACCGVFGHKPSFGRVPRSSRPNAFREHTPFSHLGPMARTVEDAAVMLDVMAGPHPRDPFSLPAADTAYATSVDEPISDYRIAYSPDMGTYPIDPRVRDLLDEAVTAFEDAGASVEPVTVDMGLTNDEIVDTFYTFAKVRWETLFDALERQGFDPRGEDRDRLRPKLVDTIMNADEVSTRAYKQADVARTRVYDGIQDVLDGFDLLVTATIAVVPFGHDESPTTIDGIEIEPLRGWLLTQPLNFTGHPAASIPAGFIDGLPVGMQVVGRRFDDATVLTASAAFERQRPWHDAYPD